MTIGELIERLEKATEPDSELDWEILLAVADEIDKGEPPKEESWRWAPCLDGRWHSYTSLNKPDYTTSIDAALTLVPEGWQWQVSNRAPAPHAGRAYIHNRELQFAGVGGMRPNPAFKYAENTAATPTIALCIAALKARAAQNAASIVRKPAKKEKGNG